MFGRFKSKKKTKVLVETKADVFFVSEQGSDGPQSSIKVGKANSVLEAILAQKYPINTSCGGMGSCGTCRVIVIEGAELLGERTELEQEIAEARGFKPNERLACQITPCSGIKLSVPPRTLEED